MTLRIYGQAPSATIDPAQPLSGRSGRRLARMLGLSYEQMKQRAVLANVLDYYPGRREKGDLFPIATARLAADAKRADWQPGDHVVVLGGATARAFGLPSAILARYSVDDVDVRVIPHPSGSSRFWNDPSAERQVSEFLREE